MLPASRAPPPATMACCGSMPPSTAPTTGSAAAALDGLPEVKRGLAARVGGLLRLPARVPRNIALELALTGAPLDAHRACAFGLVNRLVENGAALAEAHTMAEEIGANAPLAVAASKRVMVESPGWPDDQAFLRQTAYLDPVFSSEDAQEGAAAFAEDAHRG